MSNSTAAVQPFTIAATDSALADLRVRLAQTRWPDALPGSGWDYGINLAYLQELVAYWQDGFDWRAQEARLNRLPQFTTTIDGARLHFIHERGRGPQPFPLLLLHGWPDSFYRYSKILPLLTDPAAWGGDPADAFDMIIPSLHGFGFSDSLEGRVHEGALRQSAEAFWTLLTERLGYARFAAAGGDGGSPLAQLLGIHHPQAVAGIHLTDLGFGGGQVDPAEASEAEKAYLEAAGAAFMQEGAYAMLQSTKPQTLAYGLTDSPVGLASWIVEKFRAWSDCDGDIERRFSKDDLLTNIMIYWLTGTIGSSIRSYRTEGQSPSIGPEDRVKVPVGFAAPPHDVIGPVPPRELVERTLDVRRYTMLERGGHFAALEFPELLADEIRSFFRPLREAAR